jgi:hypothetical protein
VMPNVLVILSNCGFQWKRFVLLSVFSKSKTLLSLHCVHNRHSFVADFSFRLGYWQLKHNLIWSLIGVTYKTGSVLMIGFIAPYTFTQLGTTCNYSAVIDLHTLQFTVKHAVGFSVFTSRILATDL